MLQDPAAEPRRWSRSGDRRRDCRRGRAFRSFGVVTGLVAILLGSLALGGIHHTRNAARGLAVTGILLGLADTVGWMFCSSFIYGGGGHLTISLDEFEPDADALNHMAPAIARSVRANALVETKIGAGLLGGMGIGSGVILQIEHGSALIVTNRHVVDPKFAGPGIDHEQGRSARRPPAGQAHRPAGRTRAGSCGSPPTASTWP